MTSSYTAFHPRVIASQLRSLNLHSICEEEAGDGSHIVPPAFPVPRAQERRQRFGVSVSRHSAPQTAYEMESYQSYNAGVAPHVSPPFAVLAMHDV